MKKIILILLTTLTLFGFDTRTHVWISQAIINDLEDNHKITIPPFGEFEVNSSIVSAILENKRIYRMGNIGPDGFPDVIGGQVTLHAGLEDGYIDEDTSTLIKGWKTDDWLKWVLSKANDSKAKAFAYGFLGHSASDTFAHSYVNMYCGDVFDMNDGETDVEKRHIFLEKFISDRLPLFRDNAGNNLGEAYELVAINNELPINFIKNTLILNDKVAQQYALSSTAKYLTKIYEFRKKLETIEEDDIISSLNDDVRRANEACNKSWYPGQLFFSIFKSKEDACSAKNLLTQKIDKVKKIINNNPIANYSFKKAWLKQIDIAIDEYIKMSSRMSKEFMNVNGSSYDELRNWLSCYSSSFTDPTTLGSQTIAGSCHLSNQIIEQLSFLDEIKDKLGFSKIYEFKNKIKAISLDLGSEIIDKLDISALAIITVKELAVTEASLDEQFNKDESDKHLLLINDISSRVKAEMDIDNNGILNPEKYHVLYNAIILTKLTLLSSKQLNILIQRAGVANSYQYPLQSEDKFNILFNSIKTIDGNHQWLYKASPYPRELGYNDTITHSYAYKPTTTHGFKLYETGELRFNVFNKIFKGSLALGLENPEFLDMSRILAEDYNGFISCSKNPFPYSVNDKTCDEESLINNTNNSSWWEEFSFDYLKELIISYFYNIIGKEYINSIIQTSDSIEINTTIPESGIIF